MTDVIGTAAARPYAPSMAGAPQQPLGGFQYNLLEKVQELGMRVRHIADRINGPEPEVAADSGKTPTTNIRDCNRAIETAVDFLEYQIRRLDDNI